MPLPPLVCWPYCSLGKAGIPAGSVATVDDESAMAVALEEAAAAAGHGDVPVGAVVIARRGEQ